MDTDRVLIIASINLGMSVRIPSEASEFLSRYSHVLLVLSLLVNIAQCILGLEVIGKSESCLIRCLKVSTRGSLPDAMQTIGDHGQADAGAVSNVSQRQKNVRGSGMFQWKGNARSAVSSARGFWTRGLRRIARTLGLIRVDRRIHARAVFTSGN
jgi:hypothetical protein